MLGQRCTLIVQRDEQTGFEVVEMDIIESAKQESGWICKGVSDDGTTWMVTMGENGELIESKQLSGILNG